MGEKMIYLKVIILCVVLLLAAGVTVAAPGDEAPQWLQQAAAIKVPVYDKDVPAVVLRNDRNIVVGTDGRLTTLTTYAVRILTRDGREYAQAVELYLTNSSKVDELRAWLIRPNGFVKKYGKDETAARIVDPNDVYNVYRLKHINGSDDADRGLVL